MLATMRIAFPVLLLSFAFGSSVQLQAAAADPEGHWVSVWTASQYAPLKFLPFPSETPITGTLRMVVRPSLGGERIRLRLSNTYGTTALQAGAVHIALTDSESKIVPGTDRAVIFGGSPAITIPAGAPAVSDPVDLSVKALAELSVSIYLPSQTEISTWHRGAQHDSYLAGPGDRTSSLELPHPETKHAWYFLSAIEMWEPQPRRQL